MPFTMTLPAMSTALVGLVRAAVRRCDGMLARSHAAFGQAVCRGFEPSMREKRRFAA